MRFGLLVVIASVTACGGSNDGSRTSPLAPSAVLASQSGATIVGTVADVSSASVSSSLTSVFASLVMPTVLAAQSGDGPASGQITVTVIGTIISAPVDDTGTFILNNVPPGNVELRFTGGGLDTTLMVGNVQAGQTLTITIAVDGSTVTLVDLATDDQLSDNGAPAPTNPQPPAQQPGGGTGASGGSQQPANETPLVDAGENFSIFSVDQGATQIIGTALDPDGEPANVPLVGRGDGAGWSGYRLPARARFVGQRFWARGYFVSTLDRDERAIRASGGRNWKIVGKNSSGWMNAATRRVAQVDARSPMEPPPSPMPSS